jgi:hypothetical protein
MKREKTVKSNIKLKCRKLIYLENTEPGYIVKNGVERIIWGEQAEGKRTCDEKVV